ncbi:Putative auto-transporter adhesin, head GIN domain [Tenacibaculum sp. MAR_2009_124]|uniref:head GIN domain-containing protein n=1 Tax=Tenacibaculum sp. MAR_2009_124 TaxID=1250059 RepID=UPI00089AD6E6|nr:head GIN domain-containing protein [Tenacibaculum sp. MAR_2009_124]SEB42346.1 Putative auto-transporter adhesin, head GIN domain [Tenacibaculum sp. MAR_2009_124]
MKKITLLLVFMLGVTLPSQSQGWWGTKKVKGNGNVITKKRKISRFNEVSVGGSFTVMLVEGKVGTLKIEGEENIIPYLETEVKGGDLRIGFKDNMNIRITKKLIVTVPFNSLSAVSLGGSGDINVTKEIDNNSVAFNIGGSGDIKARVNTSNVKTSIGGSGTIKLSGKTNNFKCSIGGSGNVRAFDLKTNNLKASIAGSGDVSVYVTSEIKAAMVGSGNIYYKGKPNNIDTTSAGSGDVVDKN